MTIGLFAAGLQTGVVNSEVFLANVNEVGRFTLHVDVSNLTTGTAVELRGYQMVLGSGTPRVVYFSNYQSVQPVDGQVIISEPIANELTDPQALRFSLKQTIGPALTFAWKVLNIDRFPDNFPSLGIDTQGRISTVVNLVSGTSGGAGASAADVWSFTGTRSLNGLQSWNLIGNISGTITNNFNQSQTIKDMVALFVENERAIMGNIYYVDGLQGSDITGDGTRSKPFKTITRALIPTVDHNHDGIFLLPMPTGTNVITETGTVVISKADVQVYGPGYDVLVTNIPAVNRDVFDIQAEGVGLHQFRLTAQGNSANGVTFSNGAALGLVSHVWIEGVAQDGVSINVGTRNRILNSYIQGVGRDGIRINSGAGTGTYNMIENNTIRNNTLNGINLQGVDASNTRIQGNAIRDNVGFGVLISAGAANTILTDNRIFNNTLGNLSDAGTNTYQQWNWFNTDVLGIPLAVYSLVSGSVVADRVWQYTGTRIVDYLRGLVGVSGTVIASAVQGGFVIVSGTVVVSQNLDKTGYFLGTPQVYDRIGNTSGTMTAVYNVISGTTATINASDVWQYTGSKIVDAVRGGYVSVSGTVVVASGTVNTVFNVVSGTAASFDPALVWGFTGSRTLTNPQNWNLIGNISGTIVGLNVTVTGVSIDPSAVWGYAVRTLTDQIFNLPPVEQGNNLTVLRGDTLTWNPTALGSLLNHSKIYFSVKRKYTDLDSEALIQVSDTGGLLVINGQPAATPANGSITINNVNSGDITIVVKAPETAKLDVLTDVYYDVQLVRTDGSVTTLVYGLFTLLGDSSRTTS